MGRITETLPADANSVENVVVPAALASALQRVGPYRIGPVLGRGGMGVVYEASHEALSGEPVALKVAQQNEAALARIRAEIEALQQAHHPGIVRLLDAGSADGLTYYAMELLRGETWLDYHARIWQGARFVVPGETSAARGKLEEALCLALGLTRALAHLHALGWVHCDLSPKNVFIRSDGSPCLVDLGLASRHRGAIGREVLEIIDRPMGTLGYMAPEQALGLAVDGRADLYSLGTILFWTLTGRSPPRALVAPSAWVRDVPEDLDALVLRLLSHDRAQRAVTAVEAVRVLKSVTGAPVVPSVAVAGQLFRPRVVGREAVLEALGEAVRALDERGRCVFIGGVSGVGKTTVVTAAARSALANRARIVVGACVPLDASGGPHRLHQRAPSLSPLLPLLHAIVDHHQLSVAGCDPEQRECLRSFARYDERISQLVGTDRSDQQFTGEALESRLCFDLARLLSALAADRPVILVIDDLQWADDLTLAFLYALSPRYFDENRVLLLGTYRPEESDHVLQALVARPSCETISLCPLSRDQVVVMACDMLGFTAPNRWMELLHSRSAGNPLAVAEYLRDALEAGRLPSSGAGGEPSEAALFPDSLDALIQRRLARLPSGERVLLELCAVIGHPISRRLLEQTAQLPDQELCSWLEELVSLGILEISGPEHYRFMNETLRQCAYSSLVEQARRELHLRVGRALELAHVPSTAAASELQALAHHFARAGAVEKAIYYLQSAAELAHQSFANREVVALLTEALALVQHGGAVGTDSLWRWHFLLGNACSGLGLLSACRTHLHEMLRSLGLRTPCAGLSGWIRLFAEAFCQMRHRLWGPVRAHLAERGRLLAAVSAHDLLMQVCFFDNDAVGTLFSALASLNLAERAGQSSELAQAYVNVQATTATLGLGRLSKHYENLWQAARSAANDLEKVSSSWVRRSGTHINEGRLAEAEVCCEHVLRDARAMRYERREEEGLALLAYIRFLQGRFPESRKLYERIHSSASRGDAQALSWSFTGLAFADLMQGESEAAIHNARAGLRLAGRLPGRSEAINLHAALASGLLRCGEWRLAEQHALSVLQLGCDTTMVHFLDVIPFALAAEVFHALSLQKAYFEHALRPARAAVRRLQRCARLLPIARSRAYAWAAIAQFQRGNTRRAFAALSKGLGNARKTGLTHDAAYIELLLALRPSLAPDERRVALLDAGARLAALGASFDARAANAAAQSVEGCGPAQVAWNTAGADRGLLWSHPLGLVLAFTSKAADTRAATGPGADRHPR